MPKDTKPRKDGNQSSEESGSTSTVPPVTVRDRDDFITHLLGKHGDAMTALTKIAGEQLTLRRRAQVAEKRAEDAEKHAPGKDSVILMGDEAKAYQKIKDKGLTLDKVPAALDEVDGLRTKASSAEREKHLTDAAGKKYKKDVLSTLLGDKPLRFKDVPVMKEDKSGVEMVKGAVVITKDGEKEVETPLDEFIEKSGLKEAVLVKDQQKGEKPDKSSTAQSGARMPRQTSTERSAPAGPESITVVDRVASKTFMTPSQRRAAASK